MQIYLPRADLPKPDALYFRPPTATNIYIKTDGTTWTEVDDFYIKTDSGWNS